MKVTYTLDYTDESISFERKEQGSQKQTTLSMTQDVDGLLKGNWQQIEDLIVNTLKRDLIKSKEGLK